MAGKQQRPNKEMKLTSAEHVGRSQLISSVRRTSSKQNHGGVPGASGPVA